MSPAPAPRDPGDHPCLGSPDWALVPQSPDWDEGYLAAVAAEDEYPGDLDDYEDPDNAPPAGLDDRELAALLAEARRAAADQVRAAEEAARRGQTAVLAALGAVSTGRRGPGMPGSAQIYPSQQPSPAAGFAAGEPLDTAPGCPVLGSFAKDAAGDDDRFTGVSDDELLGVICAQDRIEANACARKHAAVAELIRRRPDPDAAVDGPSQMPAGWHEFTGRELGAILGISGGDAEELLDLAWQLETRLPGTRAAFRSGIVSRDKAAIIAWATALLTRDEARAAEAMVLDRAGRLTPASLRAAIRRAVMEVNPDAARQRREHDAKRARVERWTEPSGNAGLAGRELPSAQVLAADQRVTAWAKELRKAGLPGGMDQLRARAYLDLLLGTDSRPLASPAPDSTTTDGPATDGAATDGPATDGPATDSAATDSAATDSPGPDGTGPDGTGPDGEGLDGPPGGGPGGPDPFAPPAPAGGPLAGLIPPGFAGRTTLTIPVLTLTELAGRPGELNGTWPIDPGLARDLAEAAARNPRSTWCLTVTDSQGHAIGHGCARPAPATRPKPVKPGAPRGPDPPSKPRFTFTPTGQPGPPGGYGTWRFSTGVPGQRDLLIDIGPIPGGDCDHRHEAKGHDPGVTLRHLSQVRHATCTGPGCRRPSASCDFEHNTPYETGGRTCLCNGNPKCRFDHRLKQDPRWKAEQLPAGEIRWTLPSGRQYVTEPTRYPI